jgi:hypothetical protein
MGVLYGTEDHTACLGPLPAEANALFDGQPACFAHKFAVFWLGGPIYTRDDGYVLTTISNQKKYIPVDDAMLHELQATGAISTPPPAYEVPLGWRLAPLLTLAMVILVIVASVIQFRRRRRIQRTIDATEPAVRSSIETPGDRAVADALAAQLEPGETVEHQGVLFDREPRDFRRRRVRVGLTDRRLLVQTSGRGALFGFGGTAKLRAWPRADVTGVDVAPLRERIVVLTRTSPPLTLWVAQEPEKISFANQLGLLRALGERFAPAVQIRY